MFSEILCKVHSIMSPADIRDKARMHPLTTVFQHYTESPSQYNKETKVKKNKKVY